MNDEATWIAAAQRGDTTAFCCLVEAYQTHVYNLAYRMLGDSAEAEDAAQEAFVRAYTRLATYQPEQSFKTWLLSIVAHYCIDRLRAARVRRWIPLPVEQETWEPALSAPGPEEDLIRSEQEATVRRLLASLTPDYRLPIVLFYWYDMSCEEIAEITGSAIGTIKSRLSRARAQLADRLAHRQTNASTSVTVDHNATSPDNTSGRWLKHGLRSV